MLPESIDQKDELRKRARNLQDPLQRLIDSLPERVRPQNQIDFSSTWDDEVPPDFEDRWDNGAPWVDWDNKAE